MNYPDQTRNLNPTKPAIIAMYIYHDEYAKQNGGSMDFWDSLTNYEKKVCFELLEKLDISPMSPKEELQ